MIIIIVAAVIKPNYFSIDFKLLIILGLCLSLIGDIFLMFKQSDYFTKGLLAFLIAHLAYLAAIVNEGSLLENWLILIPILIYISLLLKFILPNAGKKKLYVFIYATVIGILLWQVASLTLVLKHQQIFILMAGISLFTISDSILAYNKFGKIVKNAQIKILSTYYIAQILIMLSI